MTGEAFFLPAFAMAEYNFYHLDDRGKGTGTSGTALTELTC
jgi:hypothetical protein